MSNFINDNEWGSYWEFELNRFIEPYFNSKMNDKFISFTTLRSSDIYKNKKDWWRFDTLYNIYEYNNSEPVRQIKFEIKTDKYDCTGNICIEKKCSNKLSGVFHTEADYFIYYMPRYKKNNLYLFKPKELSIFLEKYNHTLKYLGDGGRSLSYIITKDIFDQDIIDNNIGKILTFDSPIPSHFNIDKFIDSKKVVYESTDIKKYEDPFDFK